MLDFQVLETEHKLDDVRTKENRLVFELNEENRKVEEEKQRLKEEQERLKEQEAKNQREISNLQEQFGQVYLKIDY